MNTITIHKIPALAFVSILSLTTGCANYGGGTYGGGYGATAGTATTTSANMGFADNLIRSVSPLLNPATRRYTSSASQSIRRLDMEAKRQEREAKNIQMLEQRQQRIDRLKAEREERMAEQKRRRDAMTPAQRQVAAEARKKQDEGIAKSTTTSTSKCDDYHRYLVEKSLENYNGRVSSKMTGSQLIQATAVITKGRSTNDPEMDGMIKTIVNSIFQLKDKGYSDSEVLKLSCDS
ncbi:MAG: hypothetical protein PHO08_14010 [Methylococcales bacterium]|nr:hypothetical protein [Methylococcales bacterium]MDD5632440.1 hypothetical protein [Methylococcales bacterium]